MGTKLAIPVHHKRHPDISKHTLPEFFITTVKTTDGHSMSYVHARDSDWLCQTLNEEMAQNLANELNNTFEKVFRKAWRPNSK